MFSSVRNLLTKLIDYAGLFPPASLDMTSAVRNFEGYRRQEFAWMLGRFVVHAARLRELEEAMGVAVWPLSVLAGPNTGRDLAEIQTFGLRHPGSIQTIEMKATFAGNILEMPLGGLNEMRTFFEIPVSGDTAAQLSAISKQSCCAKIRTGGVEPDAIPDAASLARFLQLASTLHVAFKATAGLHHPIRGLYRLTYDENSPSALMHGFLNLFLAAGYVRKHAGFPLVGDLVEEQSADAFQFTNDGVAWRNNWLAAEEIAAMRSTFGLSFGSCSFEEPIEDLRSMGLLC